MRRVRSGVLIESRYPGVILGVVPSKEELLLVDLPLRTDDGRDWIGRLASTGRPRFLAMMDQHPDRSLGARVFDIPIVAQDATIEAMRGWSDAFKGGARPIGAEADSLKRITGVQRSVPDVGFAEELKLHLGDREVLFWHRAGPTPGSMWVVLPEAEIAFIGDTVTVSEPPYVGEADIEAWLDSLDELRSSKFDSFHLISGRDGLVDRDALNQMARFVRKIPIRLERLRKKGAPNDAADSAAKGLMKDYNVPNPRRDLVQLRLAAGLRGLYARTYGSRS